MQQMTDRAEAQRAELELDQPGSLQCPLQLALPARPSGKQEADRSIALVREPTGSEHQHLRRGGIQPLNVIDRYQERLLFCQQPQHMKKRSGNRKRFRTAVGCVHPVQRHVKCQPLRAGNLTENTQADAIEQVSHRSEQ